MEPAAKKARREVMAPALPTTLSEEGKAERTRLLLSDEGRSPIVQLLIGDAIGDAFGLGIEMDCAQSIRKKVVIPPVDWPENPLAPNAAPATQRGMYSDDCEMTVGLMKALMKHGISVDGEGMLQSWEEEWRLEGRQRIGHGSIRFVWAGKQTLEEVREMQKNKDPPGNAPPMRSLPLLFLEDNDRHRLCAENADTTHPHPQARAASLVVAAGARWLIVSRGAQRNILSATVRELRTSAISDERTEAHLTAVDALPDWHDYGPRFTGMPPDVHTLLCGPQPNPHLKGLKTGSPPGSIMGLGSDAMRTAGIVLYVLKWYHTPLDALAAAVDVGGDVDSTAALVLGVVGGSAGLRFGEEGGIPLCLVRELEGVEYLVAQALAFEDWLKKNGLFGSLQERAAA